MKVIKRNKELVKFSQAKIETALKKAFMATNTKFDKNIVRDVINTIMNVVLVEDETVDSLKKQFIFKPTRETDISIEEIQDIIEISLMKNNYTNVAKEYILYREKQNSLRQWILNKERFINEYKTSDNTANSTIDDNSNVGTKNIGVMNNESHKNDNIAINRYMVQNKLKELFPNFNEKQYTEDLNNHIIYKHDESSFAGAIAPYCCSISMYPFLLDGIKNIGGLSASPKNLDSFCGMYINLIYAVSSQFAGAVATSEFFVYFDYFARKQWGNEYYKYSNENIFKSINKNQRTILQQIQQYWQNIIYSINQPIASRGLQAAFVNFSYFDKYFFEGLFSNFYFPDGTKPIWESLSWLQKQFMQWFNNERLKSVFTFPVESFALIYKDGEFLDKETSEFVCEEYENGHSFFTYISDTVDSLSSCCRLKNNITTKEFNFTNGNMGIQTGSKSVITLNLNRIIQNIIHKKNILTNNNFTSIIDSIKNELKKILERIYKYHEAYNECLWDMYNSNLLPIYKVGFIDLNKQYLTIGINGLNEAAEYLGLTCNDNDDYKNFCTNIFSIIKNENLNHKTIKTIYNTECVPAESLAVKNYNWDKEDGYLVPSNRNLYASYIYIPSDKNIDILTKIHLHGKEYIGNYLDGGSAAHLNLDEHLSKEQYKKILKYAADEGCQYFTFNVPNCECNSCGFISKSIFNKCPKCESTNISLYDRIIGYLTKISNWSIGRQIEQKTRIYEHL